MTSSKAEDALQVIWGLSGLAVDHDELPDAADTSCLPSGPVVAALVAMKEAIGGFHAGGRETHGWITRARQARIRNRLDVERAGP